MDCVEHELPAELQAVGLARRWVSEHCADVLSRGRRDVLELLTSEVVANAVLHGGGALTLAVGRAPGEVVVAIGDTDPHPPVHRSVDPEATGGRGVALVAVLSQAWGWEPHPPGKKVWFRLTDEP